MTPARTSWAGRAIVELGLRRPRLVIIGAVLITIVLGALMVRVETDTNPENMLSSDDPVRELNRSLRDDFGTVDMVALGIVDDDGVLAPEMLGASMTLIEDIEALDGVVPGGVVSFASATDIPAKPLLQQDVDEIAGAGQDPSTPGPQPAARGTRRRLRLLARRPRRDRARAPTARRLSYPTKCA